MSAATPMPEPAVDATWRWALLSSSARDTVELPREWSGTRTHRGTWSVGQGDEPAKPARAPGSRVLRLCEPSGAGPGVARCGLKLTLPDLYGKAHMLAAGTEHVPTVVS